MKESLEVSADVKKWLEEKIDKVEVEKKKWIKKYQTKKWEIKVLFKKKEELVNQSNMIKLYIAKYHREVKTKERQAMVDLVLMCVIEEDEMKKKHLESQVSIVSNTIKHS